MQTTEMHSLEELQDARDAGKVIEEAYYSEGMLTPKGYAVNPTWNKRFTKSLDRYRIVEEVKPVSQKAVLETMMREEVINDLVNVYAIPEDIATSYVDKDTSHLLEKIVERIWDAQVLELENWVESTDIRLHQKEE